MRIKLYLSLTVFVITAFTYGRASVSDNLQCGRTACKGSLKKFNFETNRSYKYNYEFETKTAVHGTSSQDSRFVLSAEATVNFHSLCDLTLEITNASFASVVSESKEGSDSKKYHEDLEFFLTNYPIRVSFYDGRIHEICPASGESDWSLNIKRGIISMFQNTMHRFDLNHFAVETDVSGTCQVHYDFQFAGNQGSSVVISKTKDLNSCSDRYDRRTALHGVPYNFPGGYNFPPIVNSSSHCTQKIDQKRLVASECHETHMLTPFSYENHGVRTTTVQRLTFLEAEEIEIQKIPIENRRSLLFEHKSAIKTTTVANTLRALEALSDSTRETISLEASHHFMALVERIQGLTYPEISQSFGKIDGLTYATKAMRWFWQGLIASGTSASIAALRDEVASGSLPLDMVQAWQKSLAFLSSPTRDHLLAALPLLDLPDSVRPPQAVLSLSNLVHSFCKRESCDEIQEVGILVNKISSVLKTNCRVPDETHGQVLLALKSLGNIGYQLEEVISNLEACFADQAVAMDLRVAALQSLRNAPCSVRRHKWLQVFSNVALDSELRIQAYLGIIQCADYILIRHILKMLPNEPVRQVASFVYSHLQSAQKSSLPGRAKLQALIADVKLENKFDNLNFSMFSGHYESSFLIDRLNTGLGLEGQLVFSQTSFVPRSGLLDLSVDVFGRSLNLFEVSGRVEGLETALEKLFGPEGEYKEATVEKMVQLLRPKRRARKDDVDSNKVNALDKIFKENTPPQSPKVGVSLKVLGNELHYKDWIGDDEVGQMVKNLSRLHFFKDFFKDKVSQLSGAKQFLDSTYTLPLGVGLPLRLTAKGNALLDWSGSVDSKGLSSLFSTGEGVCNWKFQPSAAVQVEGSMTIETPVAQNGVALNLTLHSSLATEGSVILNGFRLIDLQFHLPLEKLEIVNIKSNLVLKHNQDDIPIKGIQENQISHTGCIKGALQTVLGLQLCSEWTFPNASHLSHVPWFPLTGPTRFHLSVEKSNNLVTGYRFLQKLENTKKLKSWALLVESQGQETKSVGVKSELNLETGQGVIALALPSTTYKIEGSYKYKETLRELEAGVFVGKKKIIGASLNLKKQIKGKTAIFQPSVDIVYMDKRIGNLTGEVKLVDKKGTVRYDTDLQLAFTNKLSVGTKGYYMVDDKSSTTDFLVDYRLGGGKREKVKWEMKLSNQTFDSVTNYEVHAEVELSTYPQYNVISTWKYLQGNGRFENEIKLNSGLTVKDPRYQLLLLQNVSYASEMQGEQFSVHLEASLPSRNLDTKLQFLYFKNDKALNGKLDLRYATGRDIKTCVSFERTGQKWNNVNGTLEISASESSILYLKGSLHSPRPLQYQIRSHGMWLGSTDFTAIAKFASEGISAQTMDYALEFEVSSSSFQRVHTSVKFILNPNRLLLNSEAKLGKNSFSTNFDYEHHDSLEHNFTVSLGFYNRMHFLTSHVNWKGDPSGQIHLHIDKLRDIHGEFGSKWQSANRRDWFTEFKWDANRDPLQRITLKGTYELYGKDQNGTAVLTYPGHVVKSHWALQRSGVNQTILSVVNWGEGPVTFFGMAGNVENEMVSSVSLDTPFPGWENNTAVFTKQSAGEQGKIMLTSHWGKNRHLTLMARGGFTTRHPFWTLDGNMFMTSSFEALSKAEMSWKTDLRDGGFSNFFVFQKDLKPLVQVMTSFEWELEDGLGFNSTLSFESVSSHLSVVSLELRHLTKTADWATTTIIVTQLNELKYALNLKGHAPSEVLPRCEIIATVTTPHVDYEIVGLILDILADEVRPAVQLQFAWPGKEMALLGKLVLITDEYEGTFNVTTPFGALKRGYLTLGHHWNGHELKEKVGVAWNEDNSLHLKWHSAFAHWQNCSIGGLITTSYPNHEAYGGELKFELDQSLPVLNVLSQARWSDNQVGLGVMVEKEGSTSKASLNVEFPQSPAVVLSATLTQEFETVFEASGRRDGQEVRLVGKSSMEGEKRVYELSVFTPMESLKQIDVKAQSVLKLEETPFLSVTAGAKWTNSSLEEEGAGLHILYRNTVEEDVETFSTKSILEAKFEVKTPFAWLKDGGVVISNAMVDSQFNQSGTAYFKDYYLNYAGDVDLAGHAVMSLNWDKKNPKHQLRLNSTWDFGEDDTILVQGSLETPFRGYKKLPWTVTYASREDKSTDDSYQGDQEQIPDSGDYGEAVPTEESQDWSKTVTVEVKFPQTAVGKLNIELKPSELVLIASSPFAVLKNGDLRIVYSMNEEEYTASASGMLNGENFEVSASVHPDALTWIPKKVQANLLTPVNDIRSASLYWQRTANYGYDSTNKNFSGSLAWNEKQIEANGYSTTNATSYFCELSLTTPFENYDSWATSIQLLVEEEYYAQLRLKTPFSELPSLSGQGRLKWMDYATKVALSVDTLNLAVHGEVGGEWSPEVASAICKMVLESEPNDIKHNIELNLAYKGQEDNDDKTLDVIGFWNDDFNVKLNSEWAIQQWDNKVFFVGGQAKLAARVDPYLDDEWTLKGLIDAKDLSAFYKHDLRYSVKSEGVKFHTYGTYDWTDAVFNGKVGTTWAQNPVPVDLQINGELRDRVLHGKTVLTTPWSDLPISVNLDYDGSNPKTVSKMEIDWLQNVCVINADVYYQGWLKMQGSIKVTTSHEEISDLGLNFDTQEIFGGINGTYGVEWNGGNNVGVQISHKSTRRSFMLPINKDIQGFMMLTSSWSKLPPLVFQYNHKYLSPTERKSNLILIYDDKEIINALYNTLEQSSAGKDKFAVNVEVKNIIHPVGMAYTRTFDYSGGEDGLNFPTKLHKTGSVFALESRNRKLTGEYIEVSTVTGQDYTIQISSPSRTVSLKTNYDFPDNWFKHRTEFRWRPDASVAYQIDVENKTTDFITEYLVTTTFFTPVRNFGLLGSYKDNDSSPALRSIVAHGEAVWDLRRPDSSVKSSLQYDELPQAKRQIVFGFGQGKLPQDVIIEATYIQKAHSIADPKMIVKYTSDPSRHLTLAGSSHLQTEADGSWVLQTYANVSHPATHWNVRLNSIQTVEAESASSKVTLFYSRDQEEEFVLEHSAYFDLDDPSFQILTTSPWCNMSQSGRADLLGPQYKILLENQVNNLAPQKSELRLDTEMPYLEVVVQYDPDSVRGVHFQAIVPDKRTVSVALFHQEQDFKDSWLTFYMKLNHSRLLTSRTEWRTTLYSDGREYWSQVWESRKEQSVLLLGDLGGRLFEECRAVVHAFLQDFYSVLESPLKHLKSDLSSLAEDYGKLQQNVVDGYNDNAFLAKTIVDLTKEFMKEIPFGTYVDKLVIWAETAANKMAGIFVSSSDAFTRWFEEFRDQVKEGYDVFLQWFKTTVNAWKNRPSFLTKSEWRETMSQVLDKYRQAWEKTTQVFTGLVHEYWTNFARFCDANLQRFVDTVRPTLLELYNFVETTVWYSVRELLDFLYNQNEAMVTSPYYQKLMQFKEDLDVFYHDVVQNDWTTIWNKYYAKFLDFMQIKYNQSGISSGGVGRFLENCFLKIVNQPDVKQALEGLKSVHAQMLWIVDYFDLTSRVSNGISSLWSHAEETWGQTVLQASDKQLEAKTQFIFSPGKGIIDLKQKLPFPWHALDETPILEEIPEIKTLLEIRELFQDSNDTSLWEDVNSLWADINTLSEIELDLNSLDVFRELLPPFGGSAIISGSNHILTFDGELLQIPSPSPCSYILSRDFVGDSYTLNMKHVANAKGKGHSVVLTLTIDEAPWEVDVSTQTVRVAGIERVLPTEERGTVAFYDNKKVVVASEAKGIVLTCGSTYETCSFTISGWYFNRVGGLMGVFDYEPITDRLLPDRSPATNENHLLEAWNVSPAGVCALPTLTPATPSPELSYRCKNYFSSPQSVLRPCFSTVDPGPYRSICLNSGKKNWPEGCGAAAAYLEACENEGVTIPMPSNCMRCVLDNGQSVAEEEIKEFRSEKSSRSSADVVLVIEAKSCNEKARSKRNLNLLITTVDKELNAKRVSKNRYAVVAFGGEVVFKNPLVRTYQGQEFVSAKDVDNLLNISTVNGSNSGDVLSALGEAARLKFRPGVARIMIALPCSSCDFGPSATDVGSVQRTLVENDISLHIIMNHEFRFSKVKIGKLFLGLDANAGFTRKDADGPIESTLVGDLALRNQVRLPKSVLGSCAALALNTNGSIFSGARLEEGRKEHVKKMVSVLGRRVTQNAVNVCQSCTCASNMGAVEAAWQCSPCVRKPLTSVNYSFLVDEIPREERMLLGKRRGIGNKKKKVKDSVSEEDEVDESEEVD